MEFLTLLLSGLFKDIEKYHGMRGKLTKLKQHIVNAVGN